MKTTFHVVSLILLASISFWIILKKWCFVGALVFFFLSKYCLAVHCVCIVGWQRKLKHILWHAIGATTLMYLCWILITRSLRQSKLIWSTLSLISEDPCTMSSEWCAVPAAGDCKLNFNLVLSAKFRLIDVPFYHYYY